MSSVPVGGPSTINGVLYQILWCLFRTARLHVSECNLDRSSGEIARAVLRLEPELGGGDAQEIVENRRVVVQLKARSDEGTWSLREVVEDVLPDLYLGVDPNAPETEYRLVTEGRMGRWSEVYSFFQSLKDRPPPQGDPLDSLDSTTPIRFQRVKSREATPEQHTEPFWPAEKYTARTLFERIVEEVRKRPAVAKRQEPLKTTQRNVWHLLANFAFVENQTMARLEKEVTSLLLALVSFDTQAAEKRDAMLAGLARRAAQGAADIESTGFFAEYGLDSVPLTAWQTLRERSGAHLEGELRRRGYEPCDDVREDSAEDVIARWPPDAPMLVLSGESGQGKSWLLYALARNLATDKELVIFIEAEGDADNDLERVADVFWRAIKRSDTGPPLDRIAERRWQLLHARAERWLTVFIDGVQDPLEARALALKPWEDWGVRVAVTCQPDLARVFEKVGRGRAKLVEVQDFTVPQLQLFLANRFGDEWAQIPSDIRGTIRRPLLAHLYSEVAGNEGWRPTNEYALYARYWERLREDEQVLRPLDIVGLQRLGRSLLQNAPYPWAPEQLQGVGLNNETVIRLSRLGFLRRTPGGQFEIWHDRILNWAVAQGLVAAFRTNEIDAVTFCGHLQDLFKGDRSYSGRFLGYVPMDVVWTIADPAYGSPDILDQVIQALEQAGWRQAEVLYENLLPTIGQRIIPALYRRLRVASCYDSGLLANRIASAIATFDESDLAGLTADLLGDESPLVQRSALRILTKRPCPRLLDQIWKLHCKMEASPGDFLRPHESKHFLYSEAFDALKAGVRLDRQWLEGRIAGAEPSREPVHDLAYLLATLDNAADMWQKCKPILFEKVPSARARSLAVNIYVHRDATEVEWLGRQVGRSEDLIGASAFRALARIDPDTAVDHLHELPERHIAATRDWCFAELLARRPEATLSRFCRIMEEHPRPADLAHVFYGHESALDERTLDLLLDDLERILDADLAGRTPANQAPVWGLCNLLANVHCLRLLGSFEKQRGTSLEEKLTAWLLKRGARTGLCGDPEAQAALDVLYRFGGRGFPQVVNAYIEADNQYGRLDGIGLAVERPDDRTVANLVRISLQDELWDGKHPVEQEDATKALAALGRHKEVVDSMLKWGLHTLTVVTDRRIAEAAVEDPIIEMCLDAISRRCDPPAGALLALGVYGSTKRAEQIRRVVSGCSPDSEVAKAGVIALGLLQDQSQEAVDLIAGHLVIPDHRYVAIVALLRIANDPASEALAENLQRHYQIELALDLMRRPSTRERAAELTRVHLSLAEPFHWAQAVDQLVRYVDDNHLLVSLVDQSRLLEHLHDVAFAEEGSGWFTGSKANAISGLARFDPKTAYLAALKALRNPTSHDREYYPYILVEIDIDEAIPALLTQAAEEEATRVVWAIGRALAAVEPSGVIADWLASPDAKQRLAACRVCARLRPTPPILLTLQHCLDDADVRVAGAAREALGLLQLSQETERLVNAIRAEQDASRRWVLLDSLVDVGDPGDKHRPWPYWARQVGENLPYLMQVYVADKLEKRRKEVAEEAEKRDK